MKKVLVMIVAALGITMSAYAQSDNNQQGERPQMSKTEMIQKQTSRMVERYGLNDDQARQLLKLNTSYDGKIMGMPGGRGPRRDGQRQPPMRRDSVAHQRPSKEQMESMRKEMSAKMDAYKAEVKKIMTAEQYAKYEADLKQFQPGRKPSDK